MNCVTKYIQARARPTNFGVQWAVALMKIGNVMAMKIVPIAVMKRIAMVIE